MIKLPTMAFMQIDAEKITSGKKTIVIRKALPRGLKLNGKCQILSRTTREKSKLLGEVNIISISNILIFRDKLQFINKNPKLITTENIVLKDGFENYDDFAKFYFDSLYLYPEIYPCTNYYLIEFNNFTSISNL